MPSASPADTKTSNSSLTRYSCKRCRRRTPANRPNRRSSVCWRVTRCFGPTSSRNPFRRRRPCLALQHEISDLELQIAQQSVVYRSHVAAVSIIDSDPNSSPGALPLAYDVVRRVGGQAETYHVKPSCLLQPGDLVRVY